MSEFGLSSVVLTISFTVQTVLGIVYFYVGAWKKEPKILAKSYSQADRTERQLMDEFVLYKRDFLILSIVYFVAGLCALLRLQLSLSGRPDDASLIVYADWVVTTPLLLLDISMLLRAELDATIIAMVIQALCIVCGAVAALTPEAMFKFLWFGLGCVLFVMNVLLVGKKARRRFLMETPTIDFSRLTANQAFLTRLLLLTLLSWSIYPIVWLLTEGDMVGRDTEIVLHNILSGVSKVGFGLLIWWNRLSQTKITARRGSVAPAPLDYSMSTVVQPSGSDDTHVEEMQHAN